MHFFLQSAILAVAFCGISTLPAFAQNQKFWDEWERLATTSSFSAEDKSNLESIPRKSQLQAVSTSAADIAPLDSRHYIEFRAPEPMEVASQHLEGIIPLPMEDPMRDWLALKSMGTYGIGVDRVEAMLRVPLDDSATPEIENIFPRNVFDESMGFPLPNEVAITSTFGNRVHPILGTVRFHTGIDYGAAHGTPVLAAMSGRVIQSGVRGDYGNTVEVDHRVKRTLYAHLSRLTVREGDWVEKGDVIGFVGSTGLSTGPHLHFEVRKPSGGHWTAVDPFLLLKADPW